MKTPYVISLTVIIVTAMVGYIALALTDNDATDLRMFVNTVLNFAGPILAGSLGTAAVIYSRQAANNTNGQDKET